MKNNSSKPKSGMFLLITIVFGQFLFTEIVAHPSGGAKNQQAGVEDNHKASLNEQTQPCQNQQSLCLTEECVVSAGQLIESMDLTTDPCDDFYQFSCGGWMRKHDVPKTESENNQFKSIDDQMDRDVEDILERPRSTDSKETNMTRAIYESCLHAEGIEKVGAKPLLHLLLNSYGGWPIMTPNWNEADFDWKNVSALLRTQLGLDLFFGVQTRSDPKNKEQNIISVSPVGPVMDTMDSDEIDQLMKALRKQLSDGDDESTGPLSNPLNGLPFQINVTDQDYEDIRFFQFSLKLNYLKSLRLQNMQLLLLTFDGNEGNLDALESSFITTLSSLQSSTSGAKKNGKIQWKSYIQSIFSEVNITIKSDERILVPDVSFLNSLLLLLDKTPKRVIANYFHWKLVQDTIKDTKTPGKRLEDLLGMLGKSIPSDEFMKMSCTAKVRQLMEPAISAEFIKRFYHPKGKSEVTEIVHNLKEEFRSSLPYMGMDAETQPKALEKLAAMKEIIAYPEWITNTTLMEAYYQGLNVNKATYFDNIRSIDKVLAINNLKSLRQKRRNDEEWKPSYLYAQTVQYRPRSNAIAFSLGVLQSPVYKTGRLMAVNYGSFGVSAGHEIAHGIIGSGRSYNEVGEKEDWWSEETTDNFKILSQCFVDQYNNYSVLELDKSGKKKVNGTLTLEENIADFMGVSQAFKAYRKHVALKGPEARLPGLNQFSPEQLFFISFGNKFCTNYSKESLNKTLVSDDHSPGRYRVIGALSNSEDFSQHFKCPVGSRMNPPIKCKVHNTGYLA